MSENIESRRRTDMNFKVNPEVRNAFGVLATFYGLSRKQLLEDMLQRQAYDCPDMDVVRYVLSALRKK